MAATTPGKTSRIADTVLPDDLEPLLSQVEALYGAVEKTLRQNIFDNSGRLGSVRLAPATSRQIVDTFLQALAGNIQNSEVAAHVADLVEHGLGPQSVLAVTDMLYSSSLKALEIHSSALPALSPAIESYRRRFLHHYMSARSAQIVASHEHMYQSLHTALEKQVQLERLLRLDLEEQQSQLVKRTIALETVAQVGAATATILEADTLLQEVTDLTKDSFGLYHAHIYLLDASGDALDLIAGAGEIGRQMVAEGRRILPAQEQSLVARAARTRQGVIVNDVRDDPGFLPHLSLPNTRAELAAPMIAGNKLLGVLDVQSEQVNRFTDEDLRIMTVLAAQVSVALQNAQSFERSEKALQELNTLMRRLTREGWEGYLDTTPSAMRFTYDLQQLTSLEDNEGVGPVPSLVRPLTVQGETIGRLALAEPQALPDEAVAILDAVADRLSAHIENLRLSEQTERVLAQTEALYAGSAQVVHATSVNEILPALINSTMLRHFDHANLMFFDQSLEMEHPTDLTVAAVWEQSGKPPLAPVGTRYPVDNVPFIAFIRRDEPIIIRDIYADERMEASLQATLKSLGVRGIAIFPLVAGSQWLGILTGQIGSALEIDEDQIRQISSLVDQAAAVIQNQRLFEQAEERAHREQLLRQITAKVRGSADVETIMRTAVQEIGQALGRRTFVYLGKPEEMEAEAVEKEMHHER